MKNTKAILLSALITVSIFGAVVFTACNTATCGNTVCYNGGSCSNGKCNCPTGFTGPACQTGATTAIQYANNTFTPISITVNGSAQTIPVSGTYTFVGQYSKVATGTATTAGAASSLGIDNPGGTIGVSINWDINNNFPISDTLKVPLDVGATYFFLKMVNKDSKNVIDFYVNANFSYGQVYQDVTIPNNKNSYDLGYYLAYPSSNVQVQTSDSRVIWNPVTLPFTSNQLATVTIN